MGSVGSGIALGITCCMHDIGTGVKVVVVVDLVVVNGFGLKLDGD